MHNVAKAERNAFNLDFARIFRAEREAEKHKVSVADVLEYRLEEALNDAAVFETLDHDYEIVQAHNGQIMRALRNLDGAIKGDQASRDAVFTALHQMQDNLKHVLTKQIESEMETKI